MSVKISKVNKTTCGYFVWQTNLVTLYLYLKNKTSSHVFLVVLISSD